MRKKLKARITENSLKRKNRFRLEKKMVVQIRYYEYLYVIRDNFGDRIYTGTDEKLAKTVLRVLNAYRVRGERKKLKPRRKRS